MSDDADDSYTVISEQGWLQRLLGSFVAALIGLVLFLGSFVLLSWNEGRAVADATSLNAGLHSVISVPATAVDPANEARLVHVTGTTVVAGAAVDPLFRVAPSEAVRLRRRVQEYQWQEHEETETEKHLGGSETKRTTYSYRKVWSETPINSAEFKRPSGHGNPAMPLRSTVFDAKTVTVGAFHLDGSVVDKLSAFKPFALPEAAAATGANPGFRRVGDQFYRGNAPETPDIGDVQVTYEVVEAQPISVVAAQIGQTLTQFRDRGGRVIELVDQGTRSANDMFQEAKASAAALTWILRGVGFFLMFVGLALMSAPLSWLASIVPVLSELVGAAAVFLALLLAVPLTLLTIALAWLAYRPLVGGGLIVAAIVLAVALHRIAPRRRAAAPGFAQR